MLKKNLFEEFCNVLVEKYTKKNKIIYPHIYYKEFIDFINNKDIKIKKEDLENLLYSNLEINNKIITDLTNKFNLNINKVKVNIINIENVNNNINLHVKKKDLKEINKDSNDIDKNLIKLNERIKELENLLEETRNEIYKDYLTNVYNRKKLFTLWEKNLKDKEFYLGILDIDNFKQINDTYGHLTGDLIIKKVVEIFSKYVSKQNIFRYGGDEFVFLINSKDHKVIINLMKSFFDELHKKKFKLKLGDEEKFIKLSVSIGLTFKNKNSYQLEEVLENADKALYKVKENGKNNFCIYNDK